MLIKDDLLTVEDVQRLTDYPKNWVYGWVARPGSTERYYNSAINDKQGRNRKTLEAPEALKSIAEKLKQSPRDRLIRCYFNKTIAGIEPAVHRDTQIHNGNDYSCVAYIVPRWELSWGGETIVHGEDGFAEVAVVKPGRVTVFPSGALHQAKAPTVLCPIERVVAVFKYAQYSAVEEFILDRGWDTTEHKMGYTTTFCEHLLETAGILTKVGAPRHVVAAGALHAAYGTQFFKPPNPPSREQVRALIGSQAEQLVFDFCTTDRVKVKNEGVNELKMIAAANEYDLTTLKVLTNA